MAGYLLDTNHLSEAIRSVTSLRDRIRAARRTGLRFGTSWSALCELEVGIVQLRDAAAYWRTLAIVLKDVRIWPIDWNIVRRFGQYASELSSTGKILSHVNTVLAAMAAEFDVTLLTTDRDFEVIPRIRTENWVP